MKTIKNKLVFIPLLVTVLLIVIGIAVLVAGQPKETKIYSSGEFVRFLEKEAGNKEKKAVLYADIALDASFEPKELACDIDGNGHTLTVNNNEISCLFTSVTEKGSVKNLIICGNYGSVDNQVTAGVTLRNLGTIKNCLISAELTAFGYVNGICHTNNGVISGCFVRSFERGNPNSSNIRSPICSESDGSVNECYYTEEQSVQGGNGIPVSKEKITGGSLLEALNKYSESQDGLLGWETDKNGCPTLKAGDNSQTASVFSGGTGILLVCILALIVAVPICTLLYADKQKKQVFYNKD